MIDVCLCTHNPRKDVLTKVLDSILGQSVDIGVFSLLIIDNASDPPLNESLLDQFNRRGIDSRIVRESVPGIASARLRAILETSGEWLLFVDDDNELEPDYIEEGIKFASNHQDVGCFGGKLLLAPDLEPANWVRPFLPYLAIKDVGNEVIFGKSESWGIWEPPTAGAFIKRQILNIYKQRAENDSTIFKLGRKGKTNLSSCEDSLIMRSAFSLGLSNAYNNKMVLYHHLDSRRFKFNYLIKLMYAYGVSHVVLESLLSDSQSIPDCYSNNKIFIQMLFSAMKSGSHQSLAFGLGLVAYHIGTRVEYRRQSLNQT